MYSVVGLDEDLRHKSENDHQKSDDNEEHCKQWREDVVGHLSSHSKKSYRPNATGKAEKFKDKVIVSL